MPPERSSVDDPKMMNKFLAMIGGMPVPVEVDVPEKKTITGHPVDADAVRRSYSRNEELDEEELSASPSKTQGSGDSFRSPERPAAGTRAPATTPATTASALTRGVDLLLDPIQEHELPEIFAKLSDPNSTLEDSKYAPRRLYTKIPSRYQTVNLQARNPNTGGSVNKLDYPERQFTRTAVQQEILDKIAVRNAKLDRNNPAPVTPITPITPITPSVNSDDTSPNMTSPFEEDVIAKFKARAEASEKSKGKENVKITPAMPTDTISKTLDPNALEWSFPANTVSYTLEEGQAHHAKAKAIAQGTEAIKPVKAQNTAVITPVKAQNTAIITPVKASIALTTDVITPVKPTIAQNTTAATPVKASMTLNTKVVAPVKSAQATLNDTKAELATKTAGLGLNVKKDPGLPEEDSSIVVTSSEDAAERENATHFTSWGTPQARAISRAKVRKVVLRGLPVSADLTLVQSIIHGGAIDNFALGANGTAQVTFTTPEACDAYYAKHPNGVAVKYKGRNCVVFIEKTTDVNVVSGMLQGQLEAGASRCVRAVGADNDWGMGALIKLAEAKTRKGKVEHIADAWRNEVRTIVFRFTSIGDAVSFKSMLVRHEDWEACNIQFMDDPCEKATGVHLE